MIKKEWRNLHPQKTGLILLFAAIIITIFVFFPGLSGSWLVDDEANLGTFLHYNSPSHTPYVNIIFSNQSGPLGRSVSMATFAINHALGFFSTFYLKLTNLFFHIFNGLLLFSLLLQLFKQRAPIPSLNHFTLAVLITSWWLLLPLHTSTVLYIIQRMTQIAAFFSLASCLTWVLGRVSLQSGELRKGAAWIFCSIFIFFPLAIFSKESAFCTVAWLLLIEIFFFTPSFVKRIGVRSALTIIILLTGIVSALIILFFAISDDYFSREFSLTERLLTQPRVLFTYISNIFLPNSQQMGLFHDDFIISHSLFTPPTTLLALFTLFATLILAVWLASSRLWPISFGLLFYFSGHLVESTFIPLELYFEHRNYLPSAGLIFAAITAFINFWPWRKNKLVLVLTVYLVLLIFSTLQRSHIWGDKSLLLETSALNHPHSLRAWTDYIEDLLFTESISSGVEKIHIAIQNNPNFSGIFYLQELSVYCRINETAPRALVLSTAAALPSVDLYQTTALSIGLQDLIERSQKNMCGQTDFSPFASAIPELDAHLRQHYGAPHYLTYWSLRLSMAQWLIATGNQPLAQDWLRELWHHQQTPIVGLILAQSLLKTHQTDELKQILQRLEVSRADAPPEFRTKIQQLQQQIQQEHQP